MAKRINLRLTDDVENDMALILKARQKNNSGYCKSDAMREALRLLADTIGSKNGTKSKARERQESTTD